MFCFDLMTDIKKTILLMNSVELHRKILWTSFLKYKIGSSSLLKTCLPRHWAVKMMLEE